jgi:glycosyltransferase involved in cell wall biosynthesis
MADNPLFSIVIPTYNRARFIGKTIRSVLQQDFGNFEVIVVDDGSTDETPEIVRLINDPRIKFFQKINEERAAARNYGVQKSLGTYVTFLDSDDLLKPNHFSESKKFLEANPDTSIFSLGYDIRQADEKVLYPFRVLPNPVNQKLCEGNFLSCIGVFIKREIIVRIPFNEDRELSGSEDYELWLRMAARYPIVTVPVVTATIVNHESRSVLQINPEKLEKRRKLLKQYIWRDEAFKKKFLEAKSKLHGFMDLYVALHLAMGSYHFKAVSKLMKAFAQYPPMIFKYRFWVVIKKIVFF